MRLRHIHPKSLKYLKYFYYLPSFVRDYLEGLAHISVTDEEKEELVRQYAPRNRRLIDEFGLNVPESWPVAPRSVS